MSIQSEPTTLVAVMRQLPCLAPEDSAGRAVDTLRYSGADTLPIVDAFGRLGGVVTLRDLRPLLDETPNGETRQVASLQGPIAQWMRAPGGVGRGDLTLEETRRALAASGETTLILLDERDRYLGGVTLADLLVPMPVQPRPASIGGMATPWGVYLTNGALQAGAGNLALLTSGVLLGLLLIASHQGIGLLSWAAQKAFGWPLFALWNAPPPLFITWQNVGWFLIQALPLPLFFGLLRLLPLSGYHAAEHQAVHAMERGEPLHPEIVRRMPRVHPRCGTNVMAAGLIFTLVSQGLPALQLWGLDYADSAVLGALTTLFTWRSVGAFLQQRFTTRPATDRQIESGIAAAEDLERKFLAAVPRRPTVWRRIWCMGLPQTFVGVSLGSTAAMFLFEWMFRYLR